MKTLLALLAFVCLPTAAQDAARGRLLYETRCGGCHYERLHQRDREKSTVRTLALLRDEVARRAAQTGGPFAQEDLEDMVAYLNRRYYRLTK
ncbi:MAG: cytochrome c [Betaproteobacteria bacterium]|nr:cytochrome c [Betaproteobacteria bacterium]